MLPAENSSSASAPYDEIVALIEAFAGTTAGALALEQFVVETLAARLSDYNWVGFYMLAADDDEMLELGPYVGAATTHTRIPVSEGICGAAVAQEQTIVVDDVRSDARYLACSIETQSEIVVPVRVRGRIVGEIDIDSHRAAAFGLADRGFVERIAAVVGGFLERIGD
jgi:GAF domain-containing protein